MGCGKGDKAKETGQGAHARGAADTAAPARAQVAAAAKVAVGAFTVDLPSTWKDVSVDKAQPGQVGLQPRDKAWPLLVLSPAPSPMPFDPTDPAACAENGAHLPGVVGTPTVVSLPGGKACRIVAGSGEHLTMTVLAVGDKGVMAQCRYANDADGADCEPIVRSLALAP
ncbi:MAG TPA: hypothetical protein VHE35_31275 [Kofleriaceae bacterium]|nr:hypothetical protein [Kofleriaceae bacterium]